MSDHVALAVDGHVDRIRRLQRDPPKEYDKTAWSVDGGEDETVLIETAIIQCPDCGKENAYWAAGVYACGNCENRQRLIG